MTDLADQPRRLFGLRKPATAAVLLAVVIAGGYAWLRFNGVIGTHGRPANTAVNAAPYTASRLGLYSASPAYSEHHNFLMQHVCNELALQPEAWSASDAAFLVDMIGMADYLDHEVMWEDPKTSMQDIENSGLSTIAGSLVADRIFHGGQITPEALRVLDKAMIAGLDAKNSDLRNSAVACTYESGLWIYDTHVRGKVDRMSKLDPVLGVRTNIESKLANLDILQKHSRWIALRGQPPR